MNKKEPISDKQPAQAWHVYIVCCKDNSYYTGITTDLTRRIEEHNSPTKGARYTRPRRPVKLVYFEKAATRSIATRRELQIKKLTLLGKKQLIRTCPPGSCSRITTP
jgi:putative endonuclease